MNHKELFLLSALTVGTLSGSIPVSVQAQETVAQSIAVLDERIKQLTAQVEALQFNQDKMKRQIEDIQTQLIEIRRAGVGGTSADLQALDARVRELQAAREKDKQVILDTLARELAAISGGGSRPVSSGSGQEHVVAKGEVLAIIARKYGVTINDIIKANNLANPDSIRPGQKLIIPAK
jgi:LysM repeat protein